MILQLPNKNFNLMLGCIFDLHISQSHTDKDWLENMTDFSGFKSRGGMERETTGIMIWSEPFIVTCSNKQKVECLCIKYYIPAKLCTVRDTIIAL